MTFNSNVDPRPEPAKAMVASLPMTWAATCKVISLMTGLTLPGMMELPGLGGVAGNLLAKANGSGILEVSAPDLDDVIELFRLGIENIRQMIQRREKRFLHGDGGADVHGGGDDVIGALLHVDVVVGM